MPIVLIAALSAMPVTMPGQRDRQDQEERDRLAPEEPEAVDGERGQRAQEQRDAVARQRGLDRQQQRLADRLVLERAPNQRVRPAR